MSRLLSLCLAAAILGLPASLQAETNSFSLHTGVYASRGDYGTGTDTTYIYAPLTLKYYATPRLTLGLTVPYIYQENGTLATVGGVPYGVYGGGTGWGGHEGDGLAPTQSTRRRTAGGLGDIVASAGYVLVPETPVLPAVSLYGNVKLPTADRDRALGTGEFDVGGGVSLRKGFGLNAVYGYLGYTVVGDPPGFELRNFASFGVGLSRQVTLRFVPYIELNGATRISSVTDDILSASLGFDYYLTPAVSVGAYALKGLTDGAPDLGGGLNLGFYF
jgi:hypothetical protein